MADDAKKRQMSLLENCRMCLENETDRKMLPLAGELANRKISDLIDELFNIDIRGDVEELTNICVECIGKIEIVNEIHSRFWAANEMLKNLWCLSENQMEVGTTAVHIKSESESDNGDEKDGDNKAEEFYDVQSEEADVKIEEEVQDLQIVQQKKKINKIPKEKMPRVRKPEKTVSTTTCNICKTLFMSEELLKQHLSVHFSLVPYKCTLCDDAIIRTTSGLNRHMALHDEGRAYKCSYCTKRFTISERLRKHEFMHRKKMGQVVSKICPTVLPEGTVVENKKHQCSHCGQTFTHATNMKNHENTHTRAIKYECKYCGKIFSQMKNLRRHEKIHTGETPYKCEICAKGFIQSNDFKDHMRLHTGEMPYKCHICTKPFRTRTLLKSHTKIHSYEIIE